MSDGNKSLVRLEIAHILFMDIIGYSKLRISQQSEILRELNGIVSGTNEFREAEKEQKLVRLPTGDGMALVFRTHPEAPAQCAVEIAKALQKEPGSKEKPRLRLRMGIHSGPVNEVTDVNQRTNITGAGINLAQRVMDCADAGHILISKHAADDLEQYDQWQPYLHDLGECEVKHGVRIHVFSLYNDEVGNPELPQKFDSASAQNRRVTRTALLVFCSIAGLVIVGLLAFWVFPRNSRPRLATVTDKSIAVLPLENLSEAKENAFFADGIQEELLSSLAKIPALKVISRTSVMQYKTGITRNLREIAQQLGVSNVIEGSVRRSGNRIRVSVQLIDALTDRHIWVQDYDRTVADSLALEGELATEIAAGVGATLSPQEKARVEATPTKNTVAYDAYLRGRALAGGSSFNKASADAAIESFQEAVKLDPKFSLAWAYLSRAQIGSYWMGFDPTTACLAAAKDALDHAVALEPSLPETHLALGFYRFYGERDFAGALREFQLAEKSLPSNVDVLSAIGFIQRRVGNLDEGIAAFRRVVALDPRNIASASALAITYMAARRFSDAIAICDHILAIEPENPNGIGLKATSFWAMGDVESGESLLSNRGAEPNLRAEGAMIKRHFKEATDILSKALPSASKNERGDIFLFIGLAQQRAGNASAARTAYREAANEFAQRVGEAAPDAAATAEMYSSLGIAYAGLGDAAMAVAEGEKGLALQPSSQDPFEGPSREEAVAEIYALLGDADHAIPILQRLVELRAPTNITPGLLRLDPTWDTIRNDPRFQLLLGGKDLSGSNK